MSNRDLNLLLEDMLEVALKIKRYSNNLNYELFINDDKAIVLTRFHTSLL